MTEHKASTIDTSSKPLETSMRTIVWKSLWVSIPATLIGTAIAAPNLPTSEPWQIGAGAFVALVVVHVVVVHIALRVRAAFK